MKFFRIIRHLATGQLAVKRAFSAASLLTIEQAIKKSEMKHDGEICFAVEAALNTLPLLQDQSARERAIEVFSQLRIWDTEHNNGILIYLLLADHDVEIIADRGINTRIAHEEWEEICRTMETEFRQKQFETGLLKGINAIDEHLQKYFPRKLVQDKNGLPDKPVVL
ncbi:MAG: TPM domain-containing protein [Nitrosomonas sp.]|nr:TPM domain-containing protein [Nitrosomonas sp.]